MKVCDSVHFGKISEIKSISKPLMNTDVPGLGIKTEQRIWNCGIPAGTIYSDKAISFFHRKNEKY